eukprot:IDg786t1
MTNCSVGEPRQCLGVSAAFAQAYALMAPPKKKVTTPFKPSHKLTYAVEVVSTTGSGVVTCRCLFCEHIGRDVVEVGPNSSRKRKARTGVHYFTAPFTSAKYKSHHKGQHEAYWAEYRRRRSRTRRSYSTASSKSATRSTATWTWPATR